MTACTVGGVLMMHHSLQQRQQTPLPQRILYATRDGMLGAILCPVLIPYMAVSGTTASQCLYTWARLRTAGERQPPPPFE